MEILTPMRSALHRLLLRLLPCLLMTAAAPSARAATDAELRAAVIYNIARFVEWPADADTHFAICTVGDNTVSDALAGLAGKTLDGLAVSVRPVHRDRDLDGCRVLYITPDDAVRLAAISQLLTKRSAATLTISDAPSFLALGGMVQLLVVSERLRFRINQDLAEASHLHVNAKLLQLALPDS